MGEADKQNSLQCFEMISEKLRYVEKRKEKEQKGNMNLAINQKLISVHQTQK